MKKKNIAFALGGIILLASTFYIGANFDKWFPNQVEIIEGDIKITDRFIDWGLKKEGQSEFGPMSLTLYVKNASGHDINKPIKFKIGLKGLGLDKQYMEEFIELTSEEAIMMYADSTGKTIPETIKRFIERGKKLPSNKQYEPFKSLDDTVEYSTIVQKHLNIYKGQTEKIIISTEIPPSYRGLVLDVKQIGN